MTEERTTQGRGYSPELRERAVRLFKDQVGNYGSRWAAIRSIAAKLGCTPQTLNKWVKQAEIDAGEANGLTSQERERMRALEKENAELKRANDILRKASAYFAAAELDRPYKR